MKKIMFLITVLYLVSVNILLAQQDEGKWSGQGRASRDMTRKEQGGIATGGTHESPGSLATGFITTSGSLSTQSYDARQSEAESSGEGRVRDLTRKGMGE